VCICSYAHVPSARARRQAAANHTLRGRDPLEDLLNREDATPAGPAPRKPKKAAGGAGGAGTSAAANAKPRGRLLLEVIAGEPRRGDGAEMIAFLRSLVAFLGSAAEEQRIPTFVGREIDLHRLFSMVAACGGVAAVTAMQRSWAAVADLVHGRVRAPTKATAHRYAYEGLLERYEAHLTSQGAYAEFVRECREKYPEAEPHWLAAQQAPAPLLLPGRRQPKRGGGSGGGGKPSASCAACGDGAEADAPLLVCDYCPRAFHLACVGRDTPPMEKFWKCSECVQVDPNNDWCELCGDEGDLLCCDACPRSYHTVCLALGALPAREERWVCPACEPAEEADAAQAGAAGGAAGAAGDVMDVSAEGAAPATDQQQEE
jgi:hypothetical protein